VKKNRGGRPRKDLQSLHLSGSTRSLRRRVAEGEAASELLKPAVSASAKEDEAAWKRFEEQGELIRRRDEAYFWYKHGKPVLRGDRSLVKQAIQDRWQCEESNPQFLARIERDYPGLLGKLKRESGSVDQEDSAADARASKRVN